MNYKTKACRHFESGKCKLSGLCNFAHGSDELLFYQKLARVDDKSLHTIDTLSHHKINTSVQKIEQLEIQLDEFYQKQRQMLEQLKHFSLNVKLGCLRNDENISQMGANIIAVYNSAVSYTQQVGIAMDLINPPSSIEGNSPQRKECYSHLAEKDLSRNTSFIEMVDEVSETQMETLKQQLAYILASLQKLYKNELSEFRHLLNLAQSAFANNQMLEASKHLQLILYDQQVDAASRLIHRQIIEHVMSLKH